eukprot:GDKJ01017353.1.p1 GENE.GDKJ01017353.1~~GDKJ01017353.1.p1  ORF type:complete len:1792 (-),score=643.29 GDKJ01017353.1:1263-6152(-)
MKMYMPLKLDNAGTISHVLSEGAIFNAGDLLATLELPNGAAPPKITLFSGSFPPSSSRRVTQQQENTSPLVTFRSATERVQNALSGYHVPSNVLNQSLHAFTEALFDPKVAGLELRELLSVLNNQMPETLKKSLQALLVETLSKTPSDPSQSPLPVEGIKKAIETQLEAQALPSYSGPTITQVQLEPLVLLVRRYQDGVLGNSILTLKNFFETFCSDETIFVSATDGPFKAILNHRTDLSSDRLCALLLGQQSLKQRVNIISSLLDFIKKNPALLSALPQLNTPLAKLSEFNTPPYYPVTARARQLELLKTSDLHETLSSRIQAVAIDIKNALHTGVNTETFVAKYPKLATKLDGLLALTCSFEHGSDVRKFALEMLIRHLYHPLGDIANVCIASEGETPETGCDGSGFSGAAGTLDNLLRSATPRNSTSSPLPLTTLLVGGLTHGPLGVDLASDGKSATARVESSVHSNNSDSRLLQLLSDSADVSMEGASGATTSVFGVITEGGEAVGKAIVDAATDAIRVINYATHSKTSSRNSVSLVLILAAGVSIVDVAHSIKSISTQLLSKNVTSLSCTYLEDNTCINSNMDLIPCSTPAWTHFKLNNNAEDQNVVNHTYTNIDPPACSRLEMSRLANFIPNRLPSTPHHLAIFDCPPITPQQAPSRRLFCRLVLRSAETDDSERFAEQERHFASAITTLENTLRAFPPSIARVAAADKDGHHLLMHILPSPANKAFRYTPLAAEEAVRRILDRYSSRITKLKLSRIEIVYPWGSGTNTHATPLRLICDNPTGQAIRIRKCQEVVNPSTSIRVLSPIDQTGGDNSDIENVAVLAPHPLTLPLTHKRAQAAAVQTVYCYDFLTLIDQAIRDRWRDAYVSASNSHIQSVSSPLITSPIQPATIPFMPEVVLEATELSLNQRGALEEVRRSPGGNNVGMVVWRLKIFTPEFPKGRQMILIANDCTFQMGTFGVQEDLVFQRASEMARREGVPRVFLACNSGARMGIANEVLKVFKVEWIDVNDPTKGFKYIYLTENDYNKLSALDAVVCERIEHPQHGHVYKISDVIGSEGGLGVENLCGSGAIAGETSRAYRETFTLTYVTGRNVGIGAYITRLGQRVIQKRTGAPLLLTGYQALNRLVGRDVYSSNDEIGGVDVMFRNGVTHEVVDTDLDGCKSILNWLSYVPEKKGGALPVLIQPTDSPTRPITFKIQSTTSDPRLMLTGAPDEEGIWQGGLLDKGSFTEYLTEWAKSVIIGRGRLGGYPLGCIVVETRVTEAVQPADPAAPLTSEAISKRAGQVWYPDSAYKTAQAINDFNKEELPLMILANWRGFSGGQRDMFLEVLKFGSFIVDALVDFKQPCMVYIPPKGELRGGAWVVVDPRINPSSMEMFADTDSRGGVLEPTGTVEIKLRERQLTDLALRLDDKLKTLTAQDELLASEGMPVDGVERLAIKEAKEKRISDLMNIYKQVAIHFADLHDTSVRMKKKHAITCAVQWTRAREFFYWRLRRQLILFTLRAEVMKAVPSVSATRAERLVLSWVDQDCGSAGSSIEGLAEDEEHSNIFQNKQKNQQASSSINTEATELEEEIQASMRVVRWAKISGATLLQRLQQLRVGYLQQQVADLQTQLQAIQQQQQQH